MELLNEALQAYLEQHTEQEPEVLALLARETHVKVPMPRMLSGHFQGRLLSMLSKLVRPQKILEIGTYTGYATICLAEGLADGGLLHTIDINEELHDMAARFFKTAGLSGRIIQHTGNAARIIPGIDEVFDLVFIDADKKSNEIYYDLVVKKLLPGGLIIVDNVLWSGKVVAGAEDQDTVTIRKFNEKVAADVRTEKLILPVRDGLFVIRKI